MGDNQYRYIPFEAQLYILPCILVNGTVTLSGSARLLGMGLFIVLASGADRDRMPHYVSFLSQYSRFAGIQIERLKII